MISARDVTQHRAELIQVRSDPLKIERYLWPNGLQLIYQPDHQTPLLSYQTWVKVGSANEIRGATGAAHLFEHLMFKGTPKYPEGEFDRLLEEVGGDVNAATWLDWTYYHVDLPSAHLERVVHLEADRLAHLTLTSELFESERAVVMNERRECIEDDPEGQLDEMLWFYGLGEGHPYAHPTIGWMEDISQLSIPTCLDFYRRYYAINQVILVVSGDVERDRLLSLIDKAYGDLDAQPAPSEISFPPRSTPSPSYHELTLAIHAPKVQMGFRVPSVMHPLMVALECLDELLFGGDSARLYQTLVYEEERVSDLYSSIPRFRGDALYEIAFDLLPGQDPKSVIDRVLAEFQRISHEGVEDTELERARISKELGGYLSLQTSHQRAQTLGFWSVVTGDIDEMFNRQKRISAVNLDDIKQIATLLLDPDRLITVVGMPQS
jgi:zinc protease